MENGVSTQVGDLLFSEKFNQTQFGDLGTCPEIWKSQYTEFLFKKRYFWKQRMNLIRCESLKQQEHEGIQRNLVIDKQVSKTSRVSLRKLTLGWNINLTINLIHSLKLCSKLI